MFVCVVELMYVVLAYGVYGHLLHVMSGDHACVCYMSAWVHSDM